VAAGALRRNRKNVSREEPVWGGGVFRAAELLKPNMATEKSDNYLPGEIYGEPDREKKGLAGKRRGSSARRGETRKRKTPDAAIRPLLLSERRRRARQAIGFLKTKAKGGVLIQGERVCRVNNRLHLEEKGVDDYCL